MPSFFSNAAIATMAICLALGAEAQPRSAGRSKEIIAQAKANLTRDLKDPQAAQFRGLFISEDDGLPYLCGEVNAKNAYGAYVGFYKFYSSGLSTNLHGMADPASSTYELTRERIERRCGNKIADVK